MQENLIDYLEKNKISPLKKVTKKNSYNLIGKFNNIYSRRFADLYIKESFVEKGIKDSYWMRQTVLFEGMSIDNRIISIHFKNDTERYDCAEVKVCDKERNLEYKFEKDFGLYLVQSGHDWKNEIIISKTFKDYSFI